MILFTNVNIVHKIFIKDVLKFIIDQKKSVKVVIKCNLILLKYIF